MAASVRHVTLVSILYYREAVAIAAKTNIVDMSGRACVDLGRTRTTDTNILISHSPRSNAGAPLLHHFGFGSGHGDPVDVETGFWGLGQSPSWGLGRSPSGVRGRAPRKKILLFIYRP